MKKYTYKREIFLCDHTHKARVILGAVWITISVVLLLVSLATGEKNIYIGGITVAAMAGIPMFFVMRSGLKGGKKTYMLWQNHRNKMMKTGSRMVGKVAASGGHRYYKQHWDYSMGEEGWERSTYSTRESDWWIEVEYFDTRDGTVKTAKGEDMNRNGKYLIGMRADVYVKGIATYIDIPD